MKKEELDSKLSQLEQEYDLSRKKLMKEFCDANNPYQVGDIFTDHIGSILVEKIKYYFPSYKEQTFCVYYGIELKKDLTPKKIIARRNAYQTNDIKNEAK